MKTPRRPLALLLIALACVGCSEEEDPSMLRIRVSGHTDTAREPILSGGETISLVYDDRPFDPKRLPNTTIEWAILNRTSRTIVGRAPTLRASALPATGSVLIEVYVERKGDVVRRASRFVYRPQSPGLIPSTAATPATPAAPKPPEPPTVAAPSSPRRGLAEALADGN